MQSFRRDKFHLFPEAFTFDNWAIMPPGGYDPQSGRSDLGERLPIDWDVDYRLNYKQFFQPSVFYRNAACLTNLPTRNKKSWTACANLIDELFDCLIEHSVLELGSRFVVNNFDFTRHGVTIPRGWSGSIMNAFAIAGLIKACTRFRNERYARAIEELAAAFFNVHYHDHKAPLRWISYVDEDGYLWFDEYPLPDGTASRVLNGHIFSIFALVLYLEWSRDNNVLPLIEGGLTTVKANALRFRRPGLVNAYDLSNVDYADYAPDRTVKQQAQLFALTRDAVFGGMAYIFYQDIRDSGYAVADWALSPLKSAALL